MDWTQDYLAVRNVGLETLPILPQRRKFIFFNGPTVPYLAEFSNFLFVCRLSEHSLHRKPYCFFTRNGGAQTFFSSGWPPAHLAKFRIFHGSGCRVDLESDEGSFRHPQRSEGKIIVSPATTEVNSVNPSATIGWETSAIRPQRQMGRS